MTARDDRPVPWRGETPEGFHFEAVEEGADWRMATDEETSKRCRRTTKRPGYVMPPSIALNRRRHVSSGRAVGSWWLYCESHAYGRWLEEERVMHWRLVKDGDGHA